MIFAVKVQSGMSHEIFGIYGKIYRDRGESMMISKFLDASTFLYPNEPYFKIILHAPITC